jgi:hypothetical protein
MNIGEGFAYKPKVFISHSSKDIGLLEPLKKTLEGRGIEVLISEKIEGGKEWLDEIENMIRRSDACILLLTKNSLKSSWLYYETGFANAERKKIIPYLGDKIKTEEIPEFIRRFQIIGVQEENLESKVGRLLEAIRSSRKVFNSAFFCAVETGESKDFSNSQKSKIISNGAFRNIDFSGSTAEEIVLQNVDAFRVDFSGAKIEKLKIENSRIIMLDMSNSEFDMELVHSLIGILDAHKANGRLRRVDTVTMYEDMSGAQIEEREFLKKSEQT